MVIFKTRLQGISNKRSQGSQTIMRGTILVLLLTILFMVSNPIHAEQFAVAIKSEQWEIPRHGEALLKQPELGRIVKQWMNDSQSIIEIRYPGGEEGEIWVQELMDWLVALGVPSTAMNHIPGSSAEDIINLVLVKRKI